MRQSAEHRLACELPWRIARRLSLGAGLALWLAIFAAPLAMLYLAPSPQSSGAQGAQAQGLWGVLGNSVLLAGAIATGAVVLGYLPAKLLGTINAASPGGSRKQAVLLLVLLCPLLLPNYVLYYGWSLLLAPTTALGSLVVTNRVWAQWAYSTAAGATVVLWYWPLAAMLLSQGWRNVDASALEQARMDARPWQRLLRVHVPLLAGPLVLAWGACFVLILSEFTTFHLSGVTTIGTQLAVLLQLTGDFQQVARASWPLALPAIAVAWGLGRCVLGGRGEAATPSAQSVRCPRWQWWAVAGLLAISLVPVGLMASQLNLVYLRQFWVLHKDLLKYSGYVSAITAAICLAVAWAAIATGPSARASMPCGAEPARDGWTRHVVTMLGRLMQFILLLTMLLPPVLLSAAILKMLAVLDAPAALRNSMVVLSAGLALRYSGLALLVLQFARRSAARELTELAAVDGASGWQTFWHVHLPHLWALPAGAAVLIMMMCMTEIPVTILLLPAGLPNFAQNLLNQMHYARDQQVISACLVLMGGYLLLATVGVVAALLLLTRSRGVGVKALLCVLLCACMGQAGCKEEGASNAKVLYTIGRTGAGNGEFVYPRGIDRAADGTLYVVDKTGRIQHLAADGRYLDGFAMPQISSGKPVGLTVGPDGNLYVADTHYHQVLVMTPAGVVLRQIGSYGQGDGQFIFPTDVAFVAAGGQTKMLVSEYGGNDRISIFDMSGKFVGAIGSFGSEQGQFSRPAAMAVDSNRQRLYVADACNHRIAIYDFGFKLVGNFGSPGTEAGQLRYPYGLALMPDGGLVVTEFGNNRLQIFSPDGKSSGTFGQSGRQAGQLIYPWGLVIDGDGRIFVADGGNNRIQIWSL